MKLYATRCILCAILLIGCSRAIIPEFDNSRPVAFVDVNIVPLDTERVLSKKTVIIEDGLIANIGDIGHVRIPPDATVIEANGAYLISALSDMHVHPSGQIEDLFLLIANGVTKIRCMWGTPGILELRDRINSGEALGPTIYTTGPGLAGKPLWPGTKVPTTSEDAREIVRKHVELGYDYIKVYAYLGLAPYRGALDEAGQLGIRVVGHVSPQVGLERALSYGQASIEHGDGFWDAIKIVGGKPGNRINRDKLAHWANWVSS